MTGNDKWTFRWQISYPAQDPYLLIDWKNTSLVQLFDCGLRVWGNVRTILKLEHLFITHAHIDHLIGFDHIIRALLGERKHLHVFGPPGIQAHISSKLSGYDWDRAADQELELEIHEIHDGMDRIQVHRCRDRFEMLDEGSTRPIGQVLIESPEYKIEACPTDHGGSPCLAYSLTEYDRRRVNKDRLQDLGLKPGPWVGEFLKSLEDNGRIQPVITINDHPVDIRWLEAQIIAVQKGKKITYITDTVFSDKVLESVSRIAMNSDILFCESTFIEKDASLAAQYHHLTARQAGIFARECKAQRLVLFHISNRYHPNLHYVLNEARDVFPSAEIAGSGSRNRSGIKSHRTDIES